MPKEELGFFGEKKGTDCQIEFELEQIPFSLTRIRRL